MKLIAILVQFGFSIDSIAFKSGEFLEFKLYLFFSEFEQLQIRINKLNILNFIGSEFLRNNLHLHIIEKSERVRLLISVHYFKFVGKINHYCL